MVNNIGANSSLSSMPFMRNVTKTMSNLSERESKILDELREKISSQFGVPVKINHGTQGESGLTVAFTGFVGGFFNGENRAEMFLITPAMLTEMAENEYRHAHWMGTGFKKPPYANKNMEWYSQATIGRQKKPMPNAEANK